MFLEYLGNDLRFKNKIYRQIPSSFVPSEYSVRNDLLDDTFGFFEIIDLKSNEISFDYIPFKKILLAEATLNEIDAFKKIELAQGYYRPMLDRKKDNNHYNDCVFQIEEPETLPLSAGEESIEDIYVFHYFKITELDGRTNPKSVELKLSDMQFRAATPREINLFDSRWTWFTNCEYCL